MQAEETAYAGAWSYNITNLFLEPETCELYQLNQDKKHKSRQFLVNQEVQSTLGAKYNERFQRRVRSHFLAPLSNQYILHF